MLRLFCLYILEVGPESIVEPLFTPISSMLESINAENNWPDQAQRDPDDAKDVAVVDGCDSVHPLHVSNVQ